MPVYSSTKTKIAAAVTVALLAVAARSAVAGEFAARQVGITEQIDAVDVTHGETTVTVERNQNPEHRVTGAWAKTSRPCPPYCFQPLELGDGVQTFGEVELIEFMRGPLANGTGVLIDARTPEWHRAGTIPGSVNAPYTVLQSDPAAPETAAALETLGVRRGGNWFGELTGTAKNGLDFSGAKTAVLYCNGPWCGQSPTAIRSLLALGYPADKLKYYRGGMQLWQIGGFTTVVPKQ